MVEGPEEEVGRHFGLTLDRNDLHRLFHPLQLKTELPGGAILHNIRDRYITLSVHNRTYEFRIAPGWNESDPIRCIAKEPLSSEDATPIRQGIAILRKLSLRNLATQQKISV